MSADRVAIVTGVSRRSSIGFAVARRMLADGCRVLVQSWTAHDGAQPGSGQADRLDDVLDELGGMGERLAHVEADFLDPEAPAAVVGQAVKSFGAVDVLVACHARASSGGLSEVTAAELDAAWAANARGSALLVQAFARAHDDARPDGRVVLFTSGQYLGPMAGELAYAISKGAIHQMTWSLSDALAGRGITVNAVNPGPTDTGWPSDELRASLLPAFPHGRWTRPSDIADVVSLLVSPDAGWVTGQVIGAEGGFRR